METYSLQHLIVAIWAAIIGTISLAQAQSIWRVRNGGMLTRAVVAQLFSFGIWTYFVFAEAVYQWHVGIMVSRLAQGASDIDRLILTVPYAVTLLVVVPRLKNGRQS